MSRQRWSGYDIVHAVVLPDLPDKNTDLFAKKTEYTKEQAKQIDLTGIPILVEHKEQLGRVGETIAYAVRDGSSNFGARAEVLFVIDGDRDACDSAHRMRLDFQRNALMNGAHRDVSLGHAYQTIPLPSGMYKASSDGEPAPDCLIRKSALEISTCAAGKRDGSHILAYLPCAETLRNATERAVRMFCAQHNYVPPPPVSNGADWSRHVEDVIAQVDRRREQLLSREVVGYHRASSGASETIEVRMPWHFVKASASAVLSTESTVAPTAALATTAPAATLPDSDPAPIPDAVATSNTATLANAAAAPVQPSTLAPAVSEAVAMPASMSVDEP